MHTKIFSSISSKFLAALAIITMMLVAPPARYVFAATITPTTLQQDTTPPTVISVTRANSSPTNATTVNFTVIFSEVVTGVDPSDFSLSTTGLVGPTVSSVTSGPAATYAVSVNTGSGDGTLRLDVLDDDSIVDAENNPLAGAFSGGQEYTIDKTPPVVSSVTRLDASPTDAYGVHYTVTFSEPVTGAGGTSTDFSLTLTGAIVSASVASASGSGTTYTITVDAGSGNGTLRLNVVDDDSISDAAGNLLGGPGIGNGNFTTGDVYTINRVAPGAATLISPNGNIGSDYYPTYTWNEVSGATHYYLWVKKPSGNPIKIWYRAFNVCNGSTCSVTPSTALGAGNHTWWIQTWNSQGYGPWSAPMSFSLPVPTPPAAVTLISPSGPIGKTMPTYNWNKVSSATWYYLWVNRPSGDPIKIWYESTAICDAFTCAATPAISLGAGSYTFWVQTWNSGGYGSWSTGLSFSLSIPGAATLVSPSGTTTSTTPTYTWNVAPGTTWYYLWVNGPSGNVIKTWYDAALVCGASTCSVTPATELTSGAHSFWVQTWNDLGYGPWSSKKDFTVSP